MVSSMGQQHSLTSKGTQLPGFPSRLLDCPPDGEDTPSQHQEPSTTFQAPSTSCANMSAPNSSAYTSSDGCTMEIQSKSVRAAIDSFIENCLAGGSGNGTPPPSIGVNEDVEICEVELNEGVRTSGVASSEIGESCVSASSAAEASCPGQQENTSRSSIDTREKNCFIEIATCAEEAKQTTDNNTSIQIVTDLSSNLSEKLTPKIGVEPERKLLTDTAANSSGASMPSRAGENLNTNGDDDVDGSNNSADDSSDGDGLRSVRLKTIIDRVLDNSLGTGHDFKSIPHEQRILPQLTADEKATSRSANVPSESSGTRQDESINTVEKKIEPMVCFMDHIEKAVERSFSSITEEEERKEKEKDFAGKEGGKESEPKTLSWSTRPLKSEAPGSSAIVDSTISVQDIVDRVISQTEVISKMMTTSATCTVQTDTKPTATASGTFYPSRAPADFGSHSGHLRRETSDRDSERRRGRPRIRSPYLDHRDVASQEYQPGAPGSGLTKEYVQSMQATVVRFGASHAGVPGMHPFVASVSSTHGFLPMAPVSAMHPAVVAAAASGLHPVGLHSVHTAASHHNPTSQPPPLLRVSPGNRVDNSVHLQQKLPHTPSRSCACSACTMYFAREREAGAGPLLQPPDVNIPCSSHSPQRVNSLKAGTMVSHSRSPHFLPSIHAESRHLGHDVGKSQKAPGIPGYLPENVHSTVYPVSHSSHGQGDGFHVYTHHSASASLESKRGPDTRSLDPGKDRADFHRPGPMVYGKSGDAFLIPVGGDQTAMIPRCPPDLVMAKHLTPLHMPGTLRPEEGPVLDLTIRRDMIHTATYVDDEKPLDLSKKPAGLAQDKQLHHFSNPRLQPHVPSHVDVHGQSAVPMVDKRRDTEKVMSGSQHLNKLETSVETYFQRRQNSPHPQGGHVSHHAVVASQVSGSCVPPSSMNSSALPHHSTHLPQHAYSSGSGGQQGAGYTVSISPGMRASPYASEPLLSPTGVRRPQLHPIPAPSLAITLGSSVTSRGASPHPSRSGVSHAPSTPPTNSPVMSSPHPLPKVGTLAATVSDRCASQSVGGSVVINCHASESVHPQGSRSVSPPGSERRLSIDDRRRGSVSKHEPITNILGNNNPADILYLICRLCRQTYGSPYGFRKHFRNQHGFEPKAEHTIVQTISATKNARQLSVNLQAFDAEGLSDDSLQSLHQEGLSVDSTSHVSPQQVVGPTLVNRSPDSGASKSPIDLPQPSADAEVAVSGHLSPHKYVRSSCSSTESRGRQGLVSGMSGSPVEEREDTKCLECPECGQAFQLNDFGSYKRHCRQHGQMRGVGGGIGNGGAGLYACTDCQSSFPEPHLLQEHLVRHEVHSAAPVVCHVCRVRLMSVAQLQEHLHTAHYNSGAVQDVSFSLSTAAVTKSRRLSDASSSGARLKLEVSNHSSGCISSTTNVQSNSCGNKGGPNSGVSNFNLMVTTPSDLKVQRLPADHIVTSASPDSSSDNKASEGSPISSSMQPKIDSGERRDAACERDAGKIKEEQENKVLSKVQVPGEDDKDSGYSERCPSNESRFESSLASPMESEESTEMFLYKHKKFSAHRKRAGSNDVAEPEIKLVKQEEVAAGVPQLGSTSNKVDSQKDQSSSVASNLVTNSASEKNLKNVSSRSQKSAVASSVSVGSGTNTKTINTEARHHMPFVWDRVTRSQAGRNARTTESS